MILINSVWGRKMCLKFKSTITYSIWIDFNTWASCLKCKKLKKQVLRNSIINLNLMRIQVTLLRNIEIRLLSKSKKRSYQLLNGLLQLVINKHGEIKPSRFFKKRNWKNAPSSPNWLLIMINLTNPRALCLFSKTWRWILSKVLPIKARNMSNYMPYPSNKR